MASHFVWQIILLFSLNGAAGQNDCLTRLRLNPYSGYVSITNHGHSCQSWSSQTPHPHMYYLDSYFPVDGSVDEARNYCRDVSDPGRPWCFTTNSSILWEYCTSAVCEGFSTDCGVVTHQPSGLIKAPDSNGDGWHDPFVDCLWTLRAGTGKVIKYGLTFNDGHSYAECSQDMLWVFESGTVAYIFTCDSVTGSIVGETLSNSLYVQFYSENVYESKGFRVRYHHAQDKLSDYQILNIPNSKYMKYKVQFFYGILNAQAGLSLGLGRSDAAHIITALNKDCNAFLPPSSGWITAPDNDLDGFYDFNLYCIFIVQPDPSYVVEFQLLGIDIELSSNCQRDLLMIGDEIGSIVEYCGHYESQPPAQTRTNHMFVGFYSDDITVGRGFNLTYTVVEKNIDSDAETNECLEDLLSFPYQGTVHVTNNGQVCQAWSSQFPHKHPRKKNEDFPLDGSVAEASNYCRDFEDMRGRPFCYTTDPNIAWGFCTFSICNATRAECGGLLLLEKKYYYITFYPDNDDINFDCLWQIKAPTLHVIQYELISIGVGNNTICRQYRLLTFFESRRPGEEKILCNVSDWKLVGETRSNIAYLHVYSDDHLPNFYFNIGLFPVKADNKVLDVELNSKNGWIALSHSDKDDFYDFNLLYRWSIRGMTYTDTVLLYPKYIDIFVIFDDGGICVADYIEISDLYGFLCQYCGHYENSTTVESRDHTLFVLFVSDDIFTGKGFNLSYEIAERNVTCLYSLPFYWYSGSVSVTNHGRTCQAWASQTPHNHSFLFDDGFSDSSLSEAHNHCRQFGNAYPWCFTSDPEIEWEFCTFSICNGGKQLKCDHTVTDVSGWIVAPDTDNDGLYDKDVDCLWKIKAPLQQVIRFEVAFAGIEHSNDCVKDMLILKENRLPSNTVILCGFYTVALAGETDSNVLFVYFYSDSTLQFTGFNLSFLQIEAPQKTYHTVLEDNFGWITPPDRDGDGLYDYNLNCSWIVKVEENLSISFRLTDLNITNDNNCLRDRLEMWDEYGVLLIVCGRSSESKSMKTRHNVLNVYFITNFFMSATGFNLTYETFERSKICLDDLVSTAYLGTVSRTNSGLTCQAWTSQHPHRHTEDKNGYFPADGSAQAARNYCRDIWRDGRPWCYTTHPHILMDYCTFSICEGEGKSCGGNLTADSGFIMAPDSNGDNLYDLNSDCLWTIEASYGSKIRYKIQYLNIESSDNCTKDFLWIWEAKEDVRKVIVCGSMEDYMRESSMGYSINFDGETVTNKLFVKFFSDWDENFEAGFYMTFYEVEAFNESYGWTIEDKRGWIVSPDRDNDGSYDFNLECFWVILVDPSRAILFQILYVLTFQIQNLTTLMQQDTDLDQVLGCTGDFLEISEEKRDIISPEKTTTIILFVTCFTTKLPPVLTSGNKLNVRFHTDGVLSGYGFNMTFEEVEIEECRFSLTAESGNILPPDKDGDGLYDNNVECKWTIVVAENKCVDLQVMFTDIEVTEECRQDALIFGSERFCGKHGIQAVERLNGKVIEVYFLSDVYENGRGFHIHYQQTTVPSNPIKKNDEGTSRLTGWFTSDDLDKDGLYDSSLREEWKLYDLDTSRYLLKLLYIDIEESDKCIYDYLSVSSELGETQKLCGTGSEVYIYSQERRIVSIEFFSDSSVNGLGFYMSYKLIEGTTGQCGGLLTSPTGYIMSDPAANCLWTIKLDGTKVIVFQILEMNINIECALEYLKVYEDHREIGKFCGSRVPHNLTTEWNVLKLEHHRTFFIGETGFRSVYFAAEDRWNCSQTYQCLLSDLSIPRHYLCDEFRDCPNGDDERFCNFRCPSRCFCYGLFVDCTREIMCGNTINTATINNEGIILPASARIVDVSYRPEAFEKLNLQQYDILYLESLNISHCNIMDFPEDFFETMIHLTILDMSFNKFQRLKSKLFQSLSELVTFILVGNTELLTFESDTFFGMTALKNLKLEQLHIKSIMKNAFSSLSLKDLKIYDSVIEHVDDYFLEKLDVKSVLFNSSKLKTFTRTMFHGISNIEKLVTDEFKFCCVRPSVLAEDKCFPHKTELSTCGDLIDIEVLRLLVWVVGIFILMCNCVSLRRRWVDRRDQFKSCFAVFVTNLAFSDILMGIYLIVIAIVDTFYRGVYIFSDQFWRNSVWCTILGLLSFVSSENSVLFMCLITIDRFLVIKYPFRQRRITLKMGLLLSAIIWALSFLAALIPISFSESDFYSQSGICLPLPITRAKYKGWGYAFGIFVAFNMTACVIVAYGQWSMYKELRASAKALVGRRSKTAKETRVAMNLLLVVVTDFFCRFPVCLLGFMALTGTEIPIGIYSWIAIVVFPINSAVNPILYTLSARVQKKKAEEQENEGLQTQEVLLRDDVEKCLHFLRNPALLQFPPRQHGFITLTEALENDWFGVKQRLNVALYVTKLLQAIHSRRCIQKRLKPVDVFVKRHHQVCIDTVLVGRPRKSYKLADYHENIAALGLVLAFLLRGKQSCVAKKGSHT